MTEDDIKLKQEDLVALLTKDDSMSRLVTEVVSQVLEAQMTEHLGADRYSPIKVVRATAMGIGQESFTHALVR